jgi:hypothetical protein
MALTLLFRVRIVVLTILVSATAAAIFLAFHDRAVPVGAVFLAAMSLLVAGAIAYMHLRHLGLAAIVALSPLPGLIAAAPFAIAHGLSDSGLLAIYGVAYVMATNVGGGLARRVLAEQDAISASRAIFADVALPAALTLATTAAVIIGWLFRDVLLLGLGAAAALVAAGLSTMFLTPLAGSVLRFGEGFHADANRARERREKWLQLASRIVEPRWGLSATGVALACATLGAFGAAPLLAKSTLLAQPMWWVATGFLLFAATFAVGREWREALAATLALAVSVLLGLWLWGRATGHLNAASFLEVAIAAAATLFAEASLLSLNRRYQCAGDTVSVARLRAIEDLAVASWFGVLGAAGAILPWILLHGAIASLAGLFLLAGAGAFLAAAMATALHALLPRRRSLDELYGRG